VQPPPPLDLSCPDFEDEVGDGVFRRFATLLRVFALQAPLLLFSPPPRLAVPRRRSSRGSAEDSLRPYYRPLPADKFIYNLRSDARRGRKEPQKFFFLPRFPGEPEESRLSPPNNPPRRVKQLRHGTRPLLIKRLKLKSFYERPPFFFCGCCSAKNC